MKKNKMFFFPYVGASSLTLNAWAKNFEPEIECIIVDYPGHGYDVDNDLVMDIGEICKAILPKIIENIEDGVEYYFCGHCMGTLVLYELLHLMKKNVDVLPKAIFILSQVSPEKYEPDGLLQMKDDELCEYLLSAKRISENLLQPEMKDYLNDMIISPIRSDETALTNYKCTPIDNKFDIETWVCYGSDDEKVNMDDLCSWENYFKKVNYLEFEGGHYFPWDDEQEFVDELKDELKL